MKNKKMKNNNNSQKRKNIILMMILLILEIKQLHILKIILKKQIYHFMLNSFKSPIKKEKKEFDLKKSLLILIK